MTYYSGIVYDVVTCCNFKTRFRVSCPKNCSLFSSGACLFLPVFCMAGIRVLEYPAGTS